MARTSWSTFESFRNRKLKRRLAARMRTLKILTKKAKPREIRWKVAIALALSVR